MQIKWKKSNENFGKINGKFWRIHRLWLQSSYSLLLIFVQGMGGGLKYPELLNIFAKGIRTHKEQIQPTYNIIFVSGPEYEMQINPGHSGESGPGG